MGKPFSQELERIYDTYAWAMEQQTDALTQITLDRQTPVLVVGSGGSFSACYLAVYLLQQYGIIAKAVTPLELFHSKRTLRQSRILFISASGKNKDILFSFNAAIEENPISIVTLCMTLNSPLTSLAKKFSISQALEFAIPAGKDGFLATNSLIAYFSILLKAFSTNFADTVNRISQKELLEIDNFTKTLEKNSSTTVLYAGWGHSTAIDIESKFTEAALGNINLADYRNFAHGRHHWFAKRSDNSSIIALVTPEDELLANKTLSLIPKSIPILLIKSTINSPYSSLELLIKSFKLIESVGKIRGIDPGKPGVPGFGRKLYNLSYSSLLKPAKTEISPTVSNIILKKAKVNSLEALKSDQLSYWKNAYKSFTGKLFRAKFGVIVFDYDGTLCRPQDRFNPLSEEITNHLNSLLKSGFVIGVVTGRGQSARKEMQAAITEKYWRNVIMGYYNGADVGNLSENLIPFTEPDPDPALKSLHLLLTTTEFPAEFKVELRPRQLTIQIDDKIEWQRTRGLILQLIMKTKISGFQILESSHSMDIIKRPEVTKLNVLEPCVLKAKANKISTNYLCIGDRGQWPGNDFELLSTQYSLSVDEVSSDKDSCWNLSPLGITGVDSTLIYLKSIKPFRDHFRFNL
jgi:hydroxymethylpyrimidine pyrophosphatase-like HAD family hydrolase